MADKSEKLSVSRFLQAQESPVSSVEMMSALSLTINERTLRRWLVQWQQQGLLIRTGQKRGTRYQWLQQTNDFELSENNNYHFAFLEGIPKHRRAHLLKQIRDQWTHSSTAIEGNTLTLGDTHFLLEQGLTISGKPLREHNEVIGHARAIELIYQTVEQELTRSLIWGLHTAVQTDVVVDMYKPNGAWKVEPNGSNIVSPEGRWEYMEYAAPKHVDALMQQVIDYINSYDINILTLETAPQVYAQVHIAVAHIHPFWDGNGRIARLLANILLLKAGLPPLMINQDQRREYIQTLANYQRQVGQLTPEKPLWQNHLLQPFTQFCQQSYQKTKEMIQRME